MLKYSIVGEGLPLSSLDYYKTLKLLSFPATEIVGKYDKDLNKTEATCIFLLDKETADKMKHLHPHNPGKFKEL